MAIARALPGFNDLGRSVTPIFLSMDPFLYWFSTFRKKMKKIYQLEVWIFGKKHHRIPFLLALRAFVRWFQMPLGGLNFVKTLVTFGIIYATEPLLKNMPKIVCLRWLTFDILSINPYEDHAQLCGTIFQNQYSLPHTLSLKRRQWPSFFCISGTSNSLSACSKYFKKILSTGKLSRERLSCHQKISARGAKLNHYGIVGIWLQYEQFFYLLRIRIVQDCSRSIF